MSLSRYLRIGVTIFLGSMTVVLAANPAEHPPSQESDWSAYGGQRAQNRYSALRQINRSNVKQLKLAWTFDTGEKGELQTNPLVIGGTVFACSPSQKIIALDGATGKLMWTFSSGKPGLQPTRGLSYWTDGSERILFAGLQNYLYALDPATGKPVTGFGEAGKIDLRNDLDAADISESFVAMTAPGMIYKDTIIVGFRAPETQPAPHGDIRAYDVHTGRLRWTFHTIPHPGEPGYETWPKDAWKVTGAANNWAGMALDEARGIVYVPTGSAVNDFYGADRAGNDLYANTLLALDANTGKLIWHFQAVHHDIWDRDFPSPPALVTLQSNGKTVDAVAQTTKHGFVFLFDRTNGKPLFPIEERGFPKSSVPGEYTSPTQPIPLLPQPYSRQRLTADMLTRRTPEAHAWAEKEFGTFVSGGQFIPLSVDKQTVVFPGFDGGAEWGGSAVDPKTGVIYVNANDVAWTGGLTENKTGEGPGSVSYQMECSGCHGVDRKGSPPAFPSLIDVEQRLSLVDIGEIIHNGRGRMPAFAGIKGKELAALLAYLKNGQETPSREQALPQRELESGKTSPLGNTSYRFTGYRKFLDPDGYPAVEPPWGTLNAIDLNTGKYLWKIPLGEYPELTKQGLPKTGSENYGGPIVTAGDLLFIGATIFDHKFRAFDSHTGELLWSADLPYSGLATPSTYMVGGKQFIVIATSGKRDPKGRQGTAYVGFALP